MPDPILVCDLCGSFQQHWMLNPLSEARDQTNILVETSRVLNLLSQNGTPSFCLLLNFTVSGDTLYLKKKKKKEKKKKEKKSQRKDIRRVGGSKMYCSFQQDGLCRPHWESEFTGSSYLYGRWKHVTGSRNSKVASVAGGHWQGRIVGDGFIKIVG